MPFALLAAPVLLLQDSPGIVLSCAGQAGTKPGPGRPLLSWELPLPSWELPLPSWSSGGTCSPALPGVTPFPGGLSLSLQEPGGSSGTLLVGLGLGLGGVLGHPNPPGVLRGCEASVPSTGGAQGWVWWALYPAEWCQGWQWWCPGTEPVPARFHPG